MSEIKLFKTTDKVQELTSSSVALEKELQTLIEKNMDAFFGVRFLKSEYIIDEGRMDSIGLDENNSPVIFEYKRNTNENVINQGLFYLDWLVNHKKDFEWVVLEKLGKDVAEKIDWSIPTVICIANDFTRYDVFAVNQISRNIKLVKYKKFGKDLIMFEYVNAQTKQVAPVGTEEIHYTTQTEKYKQVSDKMQAFYNEICEYIESLDEQLEGTQLKYYKAYKKIQNVVCLELYSSKVIAYLKLDPKEELIEEGFSRDVSKIGHYGTGDYALTIKDEESFLKAKPILERAVVEA